MTLLNVFESEVLNMAHWLVMVAVMFVVPFSMRPLESLIGKELTWLRRVRPLASLCALASLLIVPGTLAGTLASVWTIFTALMGIAGLRVLLRSRELVTSAAALSLIMLAGGGVWLFVSRAAWPTIPFAPLTALLAVAHFHYAGFGSLLLLALQERVIAKERRGWGWLAFLSIALGYGLVAAGISGAAVLEGVGATLMSLGLLIHSTRTLVLFVPRVSSRPHQILLLVSCLSLVVAMTYAMLYAYGQTFGLETLSTNTMLQVHAPLNAIGFVLLGLYGSVGAARSIKNAS